MRIIEDDKLLTGFPRIQDEKPIYMNTSFDHSMNNTSSISFSSSFRVLITTASNCINLYQVHIKGNRLNKTVLQQFIIDEGKVSGFDVHPSGDYLLVTSTHGRIFLYRIDTGELRGTIKIPLHAKECLIDPSGLYVIVQVPPFAP